MTLIDAIVHYIFIFLLIGPVCKLVYSRFKVEEKKHDTFLHNIHPGPFDPYADFCFIDNCISGPWVQDILRLSHCYALLYASEALDANTQFTFSFTELEAKTINYQNVCSGAIFFIYCSNALLIRRKFGSFICNIYILYIYIYIYI